MAVIPPPPIREADFNSTVWQAWFSKVKGAAATSVDSPTVDNFASLDANGNIQDSGYDNTSFLSSGGNDQVGDGTNYVNFATDGEITLVGTARVYKNEWIVPGAFQAPGIKPAAQVDHGIATAWEFSNGTDDTVCAIVRIPQDMDLTDAPQLKIGWDSDTADPGDNSKQAVWQVAYAWRAQDEDMTGAADDTITNPAQSASTTANGLVINTTTLAAPSSSDQLLVVQIKRMGAADTLGDVAYLNGCGLRYTANKLGVAL